VNLHRGSLQGKTLSKSNQFRIFTDLTQDNPGSHQCIQDQYTAE